MIPATYPSIEDSNNRTKILVYQVPSIVGLTRWVDYIPVKPPESESDLSLANTYANEGFMLTSKVNDITGLVPFKDYVPIYLDSTATKAWSSDNDGYIPMAELAGLLLDFTTGVLDPRINFSRTSNATVTRSDGTIGFAPMNLLTFSEQFDKSAWAAGGGALVVTANTVAAPNNTITADTITLSNSFKVQLAATPIPSQMTFSVWLRTDTGTKNIQLREINGAGQTTVTVTTAWQRFTLTYTNSASSNLIGIDQRSGTSPSQSGTLYVWGAQLEYGSTATTYNPTTVKNLLGFSELFDNAAWTKSNSFVQTNLLTYSESFDNVAWSAYGTKTVTANAGIAPNGYMTADYLNSPSGNGIQQLITVGSATTYTFSIYAKADTGTSIRVSYITSGGTVVTNTIDTVISTGESIGDGWYRIPISFTTGVGNTAAQIRILSVGATGIYIWGAQLVQGSVAGDYRRTDAAALPVYYPNHNGVVVAEKLVEDTSSSAHRLFVSTTTIIGTSYTASIYAKAGERRYFTIRPELNADVAIFDLMLGIVISATSGVTATITSVGNGWYRCSARKTATTTTWNTFFCPSDNISGVNAYTGNGTSGIYIFGAQLSDSASLDPYVLNAAAVPTAAAYYGARFDYDPVTLQPKGLLIEEQRTNLYLQSGFAGAVAGTSGTAPTSWAFTLSGGTTNAIVTDGVGGNILSYSTSAARQFVSQTTAILASTTYVSSVYINSNSGVVYQSIFSISSVPAGATVTYFANGVAVTVGTYVPLAGDRLAAVIVNSTTAGNIVTRLGIGCSANDTGTVSFSKPQLEAGAFATSYIPTAASQVTRTADVATIQGSNFYGFYNQNEGSVVVNVLNNGLNGSVSYININDGTTSNVLAHYYNNVATQSAFAQTTGGAVQANISVTVGTVLNNTLKAAGAYKVNDFALSANNSAVGVDISGSTSIYTQINIGRNAIDTASSRMNGTIKSLSYYPIRLSNDVLKGLTA